MMFWDASAIIPLCIDEPQTKIVKNIIKEDNSMIAWWGGIIECYSAFARLRREGLINSEDEDQIRSLLLMLSTSWIEIEPSEEIRKIASRLLLLHPLRAADSLQLAAALIWADKIPKGHHFVCLDNRLRTAARREGFTFISGSI